MPEGEAAPPNAPDEREEGTPGGVREARRGRGLSAIAGRNAASAVFVRLSGIAVVTLLTPFVLHRLGRDIYGVAIAAGSVYEYLQLLRGGMGAALRRFVTVHHHAGRHDLARAVYAAGFWWGALFRSVILVAGLLLAGPICRFLRLPPEAMREGTIGIALIMVAAVVADTATMLDVPIYATGRTSAIGLVRAASVWSRLLIVVGAFVWVGASLPVYGGALVVVELLPLIALAWLSSRTGVVGPAIPRLSVGSAAIRGQIFRYGGVALLAQAASMLYLATDNLLIGRIYGPGQVTAYSLGTRWAPLILGFLNAGLASLTPLFTQLEAHGESDRSREALTRLVRITSALAVPFCLVPCVLGDLFLVHWVGPEYRHSAVYMIAMLVPGTLEAALLPIWTALTARGKIGWIAAGEIITALGNVAVSLVLALVLGLGLLGFALGNTLALLAKNLLLRPLVGRRDASIPPARVFMRPLPRALAGGLRALVLLYASRDVYGGSLAGVVAAGVLGGGLCLAGSLLAGVGLAEMRQTVRSVTRGRLRM